MMMTKLAFATLIALGMSTAAIAQQQPSQRPADRSAQPRSTQQTPAPRGGDRTEQVSFDRADDNGDGRLSRDEANEIEGFDFSRADANNDTSLSRQEYMAAMAASTPRDGAASARGDANDRGRDEAARDQDRDSDRDRDRNQRQAQVTFDTADKNKDGEISRDEGRDVDGLNFTAADTDDDQSLSRQEFQVAMAGRQPRG